VFTERILKSLMSALQNFHETLYTGYPLIGVGAEIESMEKVKENKKVLYYFAIFAIVNKLLIIKIHISPASCLMQARDEIRPSCDRGC